MEANAWANSREVCRQVVDEHEEFQGRENCPLPDPTDIDPGGAQAGGQADSRRSAIEQRSASQEQLAGTAAAPKFVQKAAPPNKIESFADVNETDEEAAGRGPG